MKRKIYDLELCSYTCTRVATQFEMKDLKKDGNILYLPIYMTLCLR